ncbi:hypothetical protein SNEBB_005060 [Seison nebaliae]|nr:hypothetical protein SNEBB_005060 [Seison nebaliae]
MIIHLLILYVQLYSFVLGISHTEYEKIEDDVYQYDGHNLIQGLDDDENMHQIDDSSHSKGLYENIPNVNPLKHKVVAATANVKSVNDSPTKDQTIVPTKPRPRRQAPLPPPPKPELEKFAEIYEAIGPPYQGFPHMHHDLSKCTKDYLLELVVIYRKLKMIQNTFSLPTSFFRYIEYSAEKYRQYCDKLWEIDSNLEDFSVASRSYSEDQAEIDQRKKEAVERKIERAGPKTKWRKMKSEWSDFVSHGKSSMAKIPRKIEKFFKN